MRDVKVNLEVAKMKTNKRCLHDWKTFTIQGSDFRCTKCGRFGRASRIWDKKKGDYKTVVKAIYR